MRLSGPRVFFHIVVLAEKENRAHEAFQVPEVARSCVFDQCCMRLMGHECGERGQKLSEYSFCILGSIIGMAAKRTIATYA